MTGGPQRLKRVNYSVIHIAIYMAKIQFLLEKLSYSYVMHIGYYKFLWC